MLNIIGVCLFFTEFFHIDGKVFAVRLVLLTSRGQCSTMSHYSDHNHCPHGEQLLCILSHVISTCYIKCKTSFSLSESQIQI